MVDGRSRGGGFGWGLSGRGNGAGRQEQDQSSLFHRVLQLQIVLDRSVSGATAGFCVIRQIAGTSGNQGVALVLSLYIFMSFHLDLLIVPFLVHLLRMLWLPVASFLAGILNTIAGGGSFLSLPALLASTTAAGVGAVSAQATNTVALWPGQLTSLVAFRQQLRVYGWKLLPLGLASGAGGWVGGWLLLHTGNKRFRELLPWLLLFAAVMFVLSFPLGRWLAALSGGKRYNTSLIIGMVVVSVYVGYFGAGGGFLVMALFGFCGVHDIHEMNALKVLTAAVSIGIPAISFIVAGRVEWRFCLVMAILAAGGGYLGAHFSRKVNQKAMRWTVAAIGFVTAGYFFLQNYLVHP